MLRTLYVPCTRDMMYEEKGDPSHLQRLSFAKCHEKESRSHLQSRDAPEAKDASIDADDSIDHSALQWQVLPGALQFSQEALRCGLPPLPISLPEAVRLIMVVCSCPQKCSTRCKGAK